MLYVMSLNVLDSYGSPLPESPIAFAFMAPAEIGLQEAEVMAKVIKEYYAAKRAEGHAPDAIIRAASYFADVVAVDFSYVPVDLMVDDSVADYRHVDLIMDIPVGNDRYAVVA